MHLLKVQSGQAILGVKMQNTAQAAPPSNGLSDAELKQLKDLQRANSLIQNHNVLVDHMYTADPSAHVFNGKVYIYPSHDIESKNEINDNGDHFAMRDYHVFSLDENSGKAIDHGVALCVDDVKWASKQMWAPDAAHKLGQYYLYFPARDQQGIFRIGVAKSDSPTGPFKAEDDYIQGTFSIDPAVFEDDDSSHYLYFGGLWGGQLQNWQTSEFNKENTYPKIGEAAIPARVAKLSEDMISLSEDVKEVIVLDESGLPITVCDNNRRFFEGPWVHKHNSVYYFSYSTGDTHKIVYATGNNPYGPFTYQGVILNPVLGWTTHHSIVKHNDGWFLFYHDSTLSGGQTHLRSMKMAKLEHDSNGKIQTISPYEHA